ncbi:MAG TPA: NAD(P)-binding domain-containing protein [Rhizomicrobium sp.]|nr:NAD(P)-binding domain-containing protein [Rhizomicrobium sp.]
MKNLDVAIVGAGPYGLSIAAHFSGLGLNFQIFGKPMEVWRGHMPEDMLLKSDGFASSLSAPQGSHTLKDFCEARGIPYHDTDIPVALSVFTDYAMDFQRRFVPGLDRRMVASIVPDGDAFVLRLEDGEEIAAKKVILAAGITHFAHMPEPLTGFDKALVSHSSDHRQFARFRNREVTVVGAGSSAVDVAAHLIESGANVNLVTRSPSIVFSSEPRDDHRRGAWHKLRYPSSGLGPGLKSRLYCDWPHLFRYLPPSLRLNIVRRHLGPFSIWYMRSKVMGKANVIQGVELDRLAVKGNRVALTLSADGRPVRQVESDHVIAATGYKVELSRLHFLDGAIRRRVRTATTMPVLSPFFESSHKGLYFVGFAAAGSFGPLMRFMFGAEFVSHRIAQHFGAQH